MSNLGTTKLSKSCQITLPAEVRRVLGIEVGDTVEFVKYDRGVMVKRALSRKEQIEEMMGELDKIRTEQEVKMTPRQRDFVKLTKGWTVKQFHDYIDNLPETKEYMKEKYGI